MALSHTILTVLAHSPHSGYDISKRFEESVSCYWQASQQQIYRELGKMEQQGWVTFEKGAPGGQTRQEDLPHDESWRSESCSGGNLEPTEPTPIREELLVRVLAAPFVSQDQLVQELQRRRQVHQQRLKRLPRKRSRLQGDSRTRPRVETVSLPHPAARHSL